MNALNETDRTIPGEWHCGFARDLKKDRVSRPCPWPRPCPCPLYRLTGAVRLGATGNARVWQRPQLELSCQRYEEISPGSSKMETELEIGRCIGLVERSHPLSVEEMYAGALLGILDRIRDLERGGDVIEWKRRIWSGVAGGIIGNASSIASVANALLFVAVLGVNVACNEAN
ncbi:hypothetical protein MUK42_19041 [Musa troglodytarum]|uniref:Uncharacterized protein n=1 Tax=Musa troglodytarum TaxID=320322 RepID=A0A9E7JEZ9_9LILI|nr:hypothetical protein MUK42_19041 [Musa troglodytarum]